MRTWKFAVAVPLWGLVVVCLSGCNALLRRVTTPPVTPGITVGAGLLSQQVWAQTANTGNVTDIVWRQLDAKPGLEWGIAGQSGFVLQASSGKVIRTGTLPKQVSFLRFIDIESDGRCEFLDRGGHGWADAHVFDHQARLLWTSAGSDATDDMAAGDMDGNGKLEFVIGHNGGGGVQLVDSKGKQRWVMPDGNVWHVEITDTDGDGRNEIVHSNATGQLTIRDRSGKILIQKQIQGPYFSQFDVCRYPSAKSAPHLLVGAKNTVYVVDFKGQIVKQLNAPQFPQFSEIQGIPVQLSAGKPSHLAVIANYPPQGPGLLYIFDGQGTMVYQEVLSEEVGALASRPVGGGIETLLVGGGGRVLEYQMTAAP